MLTFSHAGKIGDLLYSFYFCKELSQLYNEKQFNIHLQTNVIKEGQREPGFNKKNINLIIPLLQKQKYINKITYSNIVPSNTFDLTKINQLKLNFKTGDIRSWYYNLTSEHLPREFQKPIIQVEPNYKFKDKIIFSWIPKYLNYFIDFNTLKPYKDKLIFFGLIPEYELFKKIYFDVPYFRVNNFLEAAQYIAGAKGIVGTPGGLFALAECLKVPRTLISAQWLPVPNNQKDLVFGPLNVNPFGGWNEVAGMNGKLDACLKEMLERN